MTGTLREHLCTFTAMYLSKLFLENILDTNWEENQEKF